MRTSIKFITYARRRVSKIAESDPRSEATLNARRKLNSAERNEWLPLTTTMAHILLPAITGYAYIHSAHVRISSISFFFFFSFLSLLHFTRGKYYLVNAAGGYNQPNLPLPAGAIKTGLMHIHRV